jgi:hypothetical protein
VVAKIASVDGLFQLEEYLVATMLMDHNLFVGLMILSYPTVVSNCQIGSTYLAKRYKIGGPLVALIEFASIGPLKYLFIIMRC